MVALVRRRRRLLAGACTVALVAVLTIAWVRFRPREVVPDLAWTPCGATLEITTECATATLPQDYDDPDGAQFQIAVARVPATGERMGSLFVNFGGPGSPSVETLVSSGGETFGELNERFDLIGVDPRGVGRSTPSIDCTVVPDSTEVVSPVDLDEDGLLSRAQQFVDSCGDDEFLAHVSTANVARDLHAVGLALGEERIDYLGFSYGTLLGATFAALFPDGYRSLVLDGPVDAETYLDDPLADLDAETAGFEDSLSRFLDACGQDTSACGGFAAGVDPRTAYDDLVRAAGENPIPADGYTADPRPVDGDDLESAVMDLLYTKNFWGRIGLMLARAAQGDGSLVRRGLQERWYDTEVDGTADPIADESFVITASEADYPSIARDGLDPYLRSGARAWSEFPHFRANSGYGQIPYGLWTHTDDDAYRGPFTVDDASPTVLVIASTHDPATPYAGARELVDDLGNARLVTVDSDIHTSYHQGSPCVDNAVDDYLVEGRIPVEGTVCQGYTAFLPLSPSQIRELYDPS